LQLLERHKRKRRLYHKDSSIIRMRPNGPNHVWAVDFVHDKLSNNRPYKMLTVVDEYTGQAFAVHVAHTMAICIWAVTQMRVCEAPFQNIYL
jgi:transposase InsO family protein